MKRKRFEEKQIVRIFKKVESGGDIRQTCRKHDITGEEPVLPTYLTISYLVGKHSRRMRVLDASTHNQDCR